MSKIYLNLKILIKYTFSKHFFSSKTIWNIFVRFFNFHYPYKVKGFYQYLNLGESNAMFQRYLNNYEIQFYNLLDKILKKDFVFIDIGSNKGDFSLYVNYKLKNKCKIFCIEPIIDNIFYIDKSIKKNKFEDIYIFNCCVGSANDTTTIFNGIKSGTSSLKDNFPLISNNRSNTIKVKLDSLIENFEKFEKIDLIKIDVESAELDVIKGSLNSIKKYRPFIAIDLHHNLTNEKKDSVEILNILLNFNYKIMNLKQTKVVNSKNISEFDSILAFR